MYAHSWAVFFQQLPFYYLIDICGVRMSGSRKRDFSLFGEGYDDEFEVEKTNDWDCDCLDLEDDGLDGILSHAVIGFVCRAENFTGKAKSDRQCQ